MKNIMPNWYLARSLIIIVSILFLVCLVGCHTNISGPLQSQIRKKLTWVTDTLQYPGSTQTTLSALWASSSKDVYAVGHNDQMGWGTMYHYDGRHWDDIKLSWSQGGQIHNAFSLTSILGFTSKDIYCAGNVTFYNPITNSISDSSLIIHYDGALWQEVVFPKREALTCIAGKSGDDLWFGGQEGTIIHYYNNRWEVSSIGKNYYITSMAYLSSENIYAEGGRVDGDVFVIFRFDGTNWMSIDSLVQGGVTSANNIGRLCPSSKSFGLTWL